jgi:hypothetical protein
MKFNEMKVELNKKIYYEVQWREIFNTTSLSRVKFISVNTLRPKIMIPWKANMINVFFVPFSLSQTHVTLMITAWLVAYFATLFQI